MQALIRDLLAYSRVGTRADGFTLIDCEQMLTEVLDDLHAGIAETEAVGDARSAAEHRRATPRSCASSSRTSSATRSSSAATDAPRVHIAVRRDGELWRFAVSDNGIGIESEYAERVFVIFQRLHSRRDYPGTGVGLAICKRIVERHGGRIWIESAIDRGTTVRFDLPAALCEPVRVAATGD